MQSERCAVRVFLLSDAEARGGAGILFYERAVLEQRDGLFGNVDHQEIFGRSDLQPPAGGQAGFRDFLLGIHRIQVGAACGQHRRHAYHRNETAPVHLGQKIIFAAFNSF